MAEHEFAVGQSDEWLTPPSIFTALDLVFDLDPASSGHDFVPARRVFVKADDGLRQPWPPGALIFMNPPFGRREGHIPWLVRFFSHANGIAICRAYTSSRWFHDVVLPRAETLVFPKGKTQFLRPDHTIGKEPGHGIVLIGAGEIANRALERSGLGWFVVNPARRQVVQLRGVVTQGDGECHDRRVHDRDARTGRRGTGPLARPM